MEKCNGRFKGLPNKTFPKTASLRNFPRGHLYSLLLRSGSGPAFRNAALGDDGGRLCRHSLDAVKVRGALGERGDGDKVVVLTPFNLCWQFQFPAEKDISHSCLKNPNHTVLLINPLAVTLALCSGSDSSTRLGFWCQQPLSVLLLFTVIIKTPSWTLAVLWYFQIIWSFFCNRGWSAQCDLSDSVWWISGFAF